MLLLMLFSEASPLPPRSGRTIANTPELSTRPIRFCAITIWSLALMNIPDPAQPRCPGVPGSALRTSQMMLLSIMFGCRFISMWIAALTERVSPKTFPVMRQFLLPLSSQMPFACRWCRTTLRRNSMFCAEWNFSCRFPLAFRIRPAVPLNGVGVDQHIARTHAGNLADAAIAHRVVANDVVGRSLRRCACGSAAATSPESAAADLQPDRVRPLDRVVLDDPARATRRIYHRTTLRQRKPVACMRECQTLHPDVVHATRCRRKHLFARRDLDRMVSRRPALQADMDRLTVGVGIKPAIQRA